MIKSYAVLCMYETLLSSEGIDITACCEKYGISVSTFRRYVALLREFFKKEKNQEVVYNRFTKKYRLRK